MVGLITVGGSEVPNSRADFQAPGANGFGNYLVFAVENLTGTETIDARAFVIAGTGTWVGDDRWLLALEIEP